MCVLALFFLGVLPCLGKFAFLLCEAAWVQAQCKLQLVAHMCRGKPCEPMGEYMLCVGRMGCISSTFFAIPQACTLYSN